MVVGGALEVASTVTAGGEISAPSAVINGTNVETHHHKDSMGGNTGGRSHDVARNEFQHRTDHHRDGPYLANPFR